MHTPSRFFLLAGALLVGLSGSFPRAARAADAAPPTATHAAPHWAYTGHQGASHWAQIDPQFETCASGHAQSPINIHKPQAADLPALTFDYRTVAPTIVNNGHTVQVNVPPGNVLQVGEHRFELLQFHFHTPSEERIEGRAQPMVAHLVHKDQDGHLGVLAVLLRPARAAGAASASGFDQVLAHLPQHAGETLTVADFQLDLASLLPKDRGYYDFDGSLTTPPCSEGVHWMVLREPVAILGTHIRAFRQLYASNARPVQALHDRVVKVSR